MHQVGFVVLAHHLPEQLERLLDALASPSSRFYVHIDRRADRDIHSEVQQRLRSRSDVTLLRSRRTKWGSIGIVLATLEGIKTARQDGAEIVVVTTGQDYPIVPTEKLLTFLSEHRDQSFLEHVALPRADWPAPGGLQRLTARGFRVLGHDWLWKDNRYVPDAANIFTRAIRHWNAWMPQREINLHPLRPFWGSAVFTLNAEACDYVINNLLYDRRLLRLFRVAQLPDEMAIQTVLMNSPFRSFVVNTDLTFTDWSAEGSHPAVLTPAHFEALASIGTLFARKFDGRRYPSLMDAVDRDLRLE